MQKLTMLLILMSSVAQALPKISCDDRVSGGRITALFDSVKPSFTSTIKLDDSAEAFNGNYLSPAIACGVPVDFRTLCKSSISHFQGDFEFDFNCANGVTGSFSMNGSSANFSCKGNGVTDKYQNLFFSGCTEQP